MSAGVEKQGNVSAPTSPPPSRAEAPMTKCFKRVLLEAFQELDGWESLPLSTNLRKDPGRFFDVDHTSCPT
jgi:hypothetical protein